MNKKNQKSALSSSQSRLAVLPSVDAVLSSPEIEILCAQYSRPVVKSEVVRQLERIREELAAVKKSKTHSREKVTAKIITTVSRTLADEFRPSLRRVINATGIILHTGLGRAPLLEVARENLLAVTANYCNLELDLETGRRGNRLTHVEHLLCRLTGAESACVVNNNAAAVLLSLNTLAFGRESIISRGQLVEIGGSFRMPDVMEKSGTIMVDIGTTNKTKLSDYEQAITERTGAIVTVHTSNYRVLGFTAEPLLSEIVDLAHRHQLPVIHDLGGGILVDLRQYGLPYEPLAQESIKTGVDVVTFSGDKVLGGPQAGIILGKKQYIEKIKENPLLRALRCDKLTLSALEPTLRLFFREEELLQKHHTLRMMTESVDEVQIRAQKLVDCVDPKIKDLLQVKIEETTSQTGSGALPLEEIPSRAVTLSPAGTGAAIVAMRLRQNAPPVVGYVKDEKVYLDMRTVRDDEVTVVARALKLLVKSHRISG